MLKERRQAAQINKCVRGTRVRVGEGLWFPRIIASSMIRAFGRGRIG
jgi:hypothetical protein